MKYLASPCLLILLFMLSGCGTRHHGLAQRSHQNSMHSDSYYLIIKDRDNRTIETWHVRPNTKHRNEKGFHAQLIKPHLENETINERDLGAGGDKKPIKKPQAKNNNTPGINSDTINDRDLGKGSDKEPMPSD